MDLSTILVRFTHRHEKRAQTAHNTVLTYPYLCISLFVTRQTSNERAFVGSSRGVQAGRFRVSPVILLIAKKSSRASCPARSATSPRMGAKKSCAPRKGAHVASRTQRPRDPRYARSTRARVILLALHWEVEGTRGEGTGARKPSLKEIAVTRCTRCTTMHSRRHPCRPGSGGHLVPIVTARGSAEGCEEKAGAGVGAEAEKDGTAEIEERTADVGTGAAVTDLLLLLL